MSSSREYFLRTDRIGFSLWDGDDMDLALMLWGNTDVTAWIGGPFDSDYVAGRLRREMETMSTSGVQYWPVFSLQDDELAGCAGLRPRDGERVFEMGIHLLPAFWGRGFAQEAAGAVIGYAFREIGAQRLFAGHHPENVASERLIKRLGFRFSGEEFYEPTGLKHPFYLLENPEIDLGDGFKEDGT